MCLMNSTVEQVTPVCKSKTRATDWKPLWFRLINDLVWSVIETVFPVLRAGEIVSQRQLKLRFGIDSRALNRWHLAGLKRLKPCTKSVYYRTDDVLEMMIDKPATSDYPEYLPEYKQLE